MLLVDDLDTLRLALSGYFSRRGYLVDEASGFDEADALLAARRYDVVLTDLRFADPYARTGLDVVRATRDRCAAIRVVVLTAYASRYLEEAVLAAGADLVVSKPQSLPDLALVIDAMLDLGERVVA